MIKKKILFITNVDWFFVSHRLPIGIEAINQGYEVHLAAQFTGQEDFLIAKGFKIHNVNFKKSQTSVIGSLISFIKIQKIIFKIKPDLVHAITIKPVLLGGLAAKIYGKASFVASISGLGYIFVSRNFISKLIKFFVIFLYKISLSNKSMKVIFQNKDDKNIITRICNLDDTNTELINGSGVNLDTFKPNKLKSESNIILFASRLLISKGVYEFIECAQKLKNKKYKFVIAGKLDLENPDCISSKKLYSFHKKGIIEYIGDKKNVKEIICASKIVVLPSYYGEGLPKILIEAAACGKPVITTDHPGCKDAIIPNLTGLLVPVRNTNLLVKAVNKIINSSSLCESMGIEGRKLAKKKYDINSVVDKHIQIYMSLLV